MVEFDPQLREIPRAMEWLCPVPPTGETVLWSPGTATPEPIPQSLCFAMGGTPAMEDLLTATGGYPVQQQRPSTAKNK